MIEVIYDKSERDKRCDVRKSLTLEDGTIVECTMTNDFYRWNKKTGNFNIYHKGKWFHNPDKLEWHHYRFVSEIVYTREGFHPLKYLLWMFQILVLGKLELSNGSICWFSKWIYDVHSFKREHGGDGMTGGTWKKYRCSRCYKRFSWDNDELIFFRVYVGFFGFASLCLWLLNLLAGVL